MVNGTLANRRQTLRLPVSEIVKATKLDETTVARAMREPTKSRHETVTRIDAVLTAEELRLRDLLLERHPIVKQKARSA